MMTNVEKVNEFLDKAGTFFLLTSVDGQPKGRPFGFHLLEDQRLYFGTGTFKSVFRQLVENPKVEILAVKGGEFLRYDGRATIVEDESLRDKARAALPQVMATYDKNGWTLGLFYLAGGHAEIRGMLELKEEFDV